MLPKGHLHHDNWKTCYLQDVCTLLFKYGKFFSDVVAIKSTGPGARMPGFECQLHRVLAV